MSTRSARTSGLERRRATCARVPTMIPACGPPSSLSPENATSEKPSATASCTVRSCGKSVVAQIDERAAAKILDHRHAARRPSCASSAGSTSCDEPVDRKVRTDASASAARSLAKARARNRSDRSCSSYRLQPAARRCAQARRVNGSRRRSRSTRCARARLRAPRANVSRISRIAAAQLLTTSASCAPVSSPQHVARVRVARAALAASRSNSRFEYPAATSRARSKAASSKRRAAEVGMQQRSGGVDHAAQRARVTASAARRRGDDRLKRRRHRRRAHAIELGADRRA